MTDPSDSDPIDRLRFALWGETDEATERVARALSGDGGDALRREIEQYQKMRDAFVTADRATPPRELMDKVLARLVGTPAAPSVIIEPERIVWQPATPQWSAAGVRNGIGDDVNLVWAFRNLRLSAVLHGTSRADRYALSGRLFLDQRPAPERPITLFVDLDEAGRTTTNPFGEFEFGENDGIRFGLRVGEGADASHVELRGTEGW
jgi:hypothetical protein